MGQLNACSMPQKCPCLLRLLPHCRRFADIVATADQRGQQRHGLPLVIEKAHSQRHWPVCTLCSTTSSCTLSKMSGSVQACKLCAPLRLPTM